MVWMPDSERAASLARGTKLGVGLHLNFTEPFANGGERTSRIQKSIIRFLRRNKYSFLFYNPLLRGAFRDLVKIQLDEFYRLYQMAPTHFDGHHHMHLCSNMIVDGVVPTGAKVRRSFSFGPGEKGQINRSYRALIDRRLASRYRLSDFLFSLATSLQTNAIGRILDLAGSKSVELQAHPELLPERDWLVSDSWLQQLTRVKLGRFDALG